MRNDTSDRIYEKSSMRASTADTAALVAKIERIMAVADNSSLDTVALRKTLAEVERAGISSARVGAAKRRLAEAEKQQAAVRHKDATHYLRGASNEMPATLDECWLVISSLKKYITMGEETKVDAKLISNAKMQLRKVEQKKATLAGDMRTAALTALLRLSTVPIKDLSADEMRQALDEATKTGVSQEHLQTAHARLKAAERRDTLEEELLQACEEPLLEVDIPSMRQLWGDAVEAGVNKLTVDRTQKFMHSAAEAQAKREAASERMNKWVAAGPLAIDIAMVARAIPLADEVGVPEHQLLRMGELVEEAKGAQSRCDAATARLLVTTAPLHQHVDVQALKAALKEAEQAGVAKTLVQLAQAKLKDVQDGTKSKRIFTKRRVDSSTTKGDRVVNSDMASAAKRFKDSKALVESTRDRIKTTQKFVQEAQKASREAATAALEVHAKVHEALQHATEAESAKQKAMVVSSFKIVHEVSYNSSLIDVDVATYEKVLCELASIDPTSLFVDISSLGANNVSIRSTLLAYATKQLLHAITRTEHPLILLSRQTPSVVSSALPSIAAQAYLERRSKYEELRRKYDDECNESCMIDDPTVVSGVEEKLIKKASDTRQLLNEAETEAEAAVTRVNNAAAAARSAADEASTLPSKTRTEAEAAEAKMMIAMRDREAVALASDEAQKQCANAEREEQWIKQELTLLGVAPETLNTTLPSPRTTLPSPRGQLEQPRTTTKLPPQAEDEPRVESSSKPPAKRPASKGGGCCSGKNVPDDVEEPLPAQPHAPEAKPVPAHVQEVAPKPLSPPAPIQSALSKRKSSSTEFAKYDESYFGGKPRTARAKQERVLEADAPSFEGLAWAPLRLQLSSNKLELLVGLARAGIYNRADVCEVVAREVTLQDFLLLENALIQVADKAPQPPFSSGALSEVVDVWASQLLGLVTLGLAFRAPPIRPAYELPGGLEIKTLKSALDKKKRRLDWHTMIERLVAVTGRSSFAKEGAAGTATFEGMISAWRHSVHPDLLGTFCTEYLLPILKFNADAYTPTAEGASSPHVAPPAALTDAIGTMDLGSPRGESGHQLDFLASPEKPPSEKRGSSFLATPSPEPLKLPSFRKESSAFGSTRSPSQSLQQEGSPQLLLRRDTEHRATLRDRAASGRFANPEREPTQLEAVIAGLAQLAWHLPPELAAFEGFSSLVQQHSDELDFAKTYLAPGSKLREQICDLLLHPGPNFRIDQVWDSYLKSNLVDEPLFWSKSAMLLFDPSAAVSNEAGLVTSIRETCAKERGSSFYLNYLEEVAASIEKPKWSGIENLRTSLRAILQHHQMTARRIAELEDEGLQAQAEMEKQKGMLGQAAAGTTIDTTAYEQRNALRLEEIAFHTASLPDLFRCVELLLGLSMRTDKTFNTLLPLWLSPDSNTSPPAALAGAAMAFSQKLPKLSAEYKEHTAANQKTDADISNERIILAMIRLFVEKPEALTGFQNLVPDVFDVFLMRGTQLRKDLCSMLLASGKDRDVIDRIASDDQLVRQRFFWSSPGMKLFGGHPDVKDPMKLRVIIDEAIDQQPSIVVAFLQQACDKVYTDGSSMIRSGGESEAELGMLVQICLRSLLAYVSRNSLDGPDIDGKRKGVLDAVDLILVASTRVFDDVYEKALAAWVEAETAVKVLDLFVARFRPRLGDSTGRSAKASVDSSAPTDVDSRAEDIDPREDGIHGADSAPQWKTECIIQSLASLFVASPSKLGAFSQLVPRVFHTFLRLGTEPRDRLNKILLKNSFDEQLEYLIAKTDDLVGAPFFWNDQVMPLCTKQRINASYSQLNKATLTKKDGSQLHLYSSLLALLLRLSSIRGGDAKEIARRTKEVLDQFERNEEQQEFIMTVFEKIDERSRTTPEAFGNIKLTDFSDVSQNGVETLLSVSGEGMQLAKAAMTTLLQNYISERDPSDWKRLFKEATNVGYMVKYMFRESLPIAKTKFVETVNNRDNFRKMQYASEVQEMLTKLVNYTLAEYGDVGIYDPEKLAEIDFLNKPELLVDLVSSGKNRQSKQEKPIMQLMTDITVRWMNYMIDRKFPPLTPHHTQAFTVMMMVRCYEDYQSQEARARNKKDKKKFQVQAFIAQMATGEGKSIVIAMLAVMMVQYHGLKVHVLENNEGLLDRDFRQNQPFYDRFGIKSSFGADGLADDDAKIVYCLKKHINKHFLRKMVEGKLDEELKNIVLIVDEVDDLVVNERPNNHYVKTDVEETPDLQKCYEKLKDGWSEEVQQDPPEDVAQKVWLRACSIVRYCEQKLQSGVNYRLIKNDEGTEEVIMLDDKGQVPKVPLAAPWLQYMNYKLCNKDPVAQTRYACVCTPYIFNKYAGIFGLTGSVGGKEELKYLTKTYNAVKFDVPRFLDTCVGNARKTVKNHGVELHENGKSQKERVAALARQYYRQVPVLVIAASQEELTELHELLMNDEEIPSDEVLRFSEFDAQGRSLKEEWQTIIDDSTKRLGGVQDNRCRVTVTDRFGGRGHDFQVVDRESNTNGGMLVIATSIPDEREWIQWRGRTARQDRPGQFYVVLSKENYPFTEAKHKRLAAKIEKLASEDEKIEELLDVADDGIGDKLREFEGEQASGEKLNEVTEKYYTSKPRSFDDDWPSEKYNETDKVIRTFLTDFVSRPPGEIKKLAKEQLAIDLA